MDGASGSNAAGEYKAAADSIRTQAQQIIGEAKQIFLQIADDYDAMARTAQNIHIAKHSLLRLTDPSQPLKRCPANCRAPYAEQRPATVQETDERRITSTDPA